MRIDPTTIVSITDPRERAETRTGRAPASPSAVVSLGDAASAAQAGGTEDAAVTARISRIREDLAAGTYVVDLDKLSERILDDELLRAEP